MKADHAFGEVVINEFLAANRDGLKDDEGDVGDWIELHNTGNSTVNLAGWSLTDDETKPGKWVFPGVDLRPGGTLVVHASGKNRGGLGQAMHQFQVGHRGGVPWPVQPGAAASCGRRDRAGVSEQRSNISTAAWPRATGPGFRRPHRNINGGKTIRGLLSPPQFSAKRGICNAQFRLHLSTEEPDAVIRYTTDYSGPTQTNEVYTEPLNVRGPWWCARRCSRTCCRRG